MQWLNLAGIIRMTFMDNPDPRLVSHEGKSQHEPFLTKINRNSDDWMQEQFEDMVRYSYKLMIRTREEVKNYTR